MKYISPTDLHQLQLNGTKTTIVDVRRPDEFMQMHIEQAMLLPLSDFNPEQLMQTLKENDCETQEIYIACAAGKRAEVACQKLMDANIENVTVITGGTLAWHQAGLPVVVDS